MITFIYLLYLESIGLPLYVGKSVSIEGRFARHFQHCDRMGYDIDDLKYLVLEIINGDDSSKAWQYAERKWIHFFRTLYSNGKFFREALFNISKGGNAPTRETQLKAAAAGGRASKGTRKPNLSLALKGHPITQKVREAFIYSGKQRRGIPKSEEHKRKIGDAHRGKSKPWLIGKERSAETKAKISIGNRKPKPQMNRSHLRGKQVIGITAYHQEVREISERFWLSIQNSRRIRKHQLHHLSLDFTLDLLIR